MITLFECWNGGMIQWNGMTPPQFVFAFPPVDPALVSFFQLCGRMGEVVTASQWLLNMAGRLIDIPDFPPQEIEVFLLGVRNTMGYAAVTTMIQIVNPMTGITAIPVALWVNVQTGRADAYNPFTGPALGPQFLPPQPMGPWGNAVQQRAFAGAAQLPPWAAASQTQATSVAEVNLAPTGEVAGSGAKSTLELVAKCCEGLGQIAGFLTKAFSQSSGGGQ